MTWPRPLRCSSTVGTHRCQRFRAHPGRHRHQSGRTYHSWSTESTRRETYETAAPWITWTWLSTDRETRITGRMRMLLTCCICGQREVIRPRIPRVGPVPEPAGGVHPVRLAAIDRHQHPGRRDPRDWSLPLRNPGAWKGGIPLEVFENVARTAQMEAQLKADDDG